MSAQDKRICMRCCHELQNIVNDQVLNNLLKTSEANFHLRGCVNTQNSAGTGRCRILKSYLNYHYTVRELLCDVA